MGEDCGGKGGRNREVGDEDKERLGRDRKGE